MLSQDLNHNITQAKENEIRNLTDNDIFEEVEDIGQDFKDSRRILTGNKGEMVK